MNIDGVYISALQAFGYTEEEARFLYIVATHSGYFVARQFLAFAGVQWGKRTTLFWNKLQSHKHARTGSMPKHRAFYHLFARKLYRQLGRENLRNRRRHELEYIQTRIAILDFVLANPGLAYLETEGDKLAFFCRDLNIDAGHLPSKTYLGRPHDSAHCSVFRGPLSDVLFGAAILRKRIVTFSFIQGSEANLSAFVHHLQAIRHYFENCGNFAFSICRGSMRISPKPANCFMRW